ncbi:MAG: phosphotransferase [Steroidobacteraceae bacterium]
MADLAQQITTAFEQEQRANRTATTRDELPLSFESMTPQWLTQVLCANQPKVNVTSFELGPVDSGSTNRRAVKLHYQPENLRGDLPVKVFCKATHALANRLLTGLFGATHAEVTFYNQIRPHLAIKSPHSYFAAYDSHSYNSMIMLEDIAAQVESFCSHRTLINRTRAESQMALLANVHAPFYQSEALTTRFASLHSWPAYFANASRFNLQAAAKRGFLAAHDVIPARLYRREEEIWPATLACVEQHHRLPSTITHNDVHLANWYVLPNDVMGLSDWGCCSRGHWSRDLAYTIATALSVEDRRLWEKDLIRYYLESMATLGISDTSFDQAWDLYRQQLLSALTWWTVPYSPEQDMPEGMQPRDTVKEFIHRITTAIDDLDTLELW